MPAAVATSWARGRLSVLLPMNATPPPFFVRKGLLFLQFFGVRASVRPYLLFGIQYISVVGFARGMVYRNGLYDVRLCSVAGSHRLLCHERKVPESDVVSYFLVGILI
jgi:hypothetical protein